MVGTFPARRHGRSAFTLIELLVVIAIIAILAVVVVLTLNPAQLLAQSRDANRVSDMATLQSALNLYTTDQSGNLNLGAVSSTYISIPDTTSTCANLGLASFSTSTGQSWACSTSAHYRLATTTGWLGINFNLISSGPPFGALPVDPVNTTSSGLFYAYNTNGSQFQVTATLESSKYKSQYGANPSTSLFPEVISGGTPGISALFNPTGLAGYWPMDEGSGSSALDQSGNGNTGTWGGSPSCNGTFYASGKIGSAAGCFGGGVAAINIGSSSLSLQPAQISVSAWVNRSSINSYDRVVANYLGGSTNTGAFMLGDGGSSNLLCIVFIASGNAGSVYSAANSFAGVGAWYQVGCTFDGSVITAYINGVAVGSTAKAGSLYYGYGRPWIIGASYSTSTWGQNSMHGTIDDVRIYNRALSAAEMAALYNAGK